MLKIIDDKELRSEESIEREYKGCMFIMINYTDIQEPKGYLYCVSTARDSYHEICRKADELEKKNTPCILAGNYADAVGPGLVYEMENENV